MKKTYLPGAILALAGVLGFSSVTFGQSDSQKKPSPAKQGKPAQKPHKVWTDEDFPSSGSSSAAKETQTAQTGTAQQSGTGTQASNSGQVQKGVPPPTLTNPKSLEEADKMIAWEGRDIQAQEEFLDNLKRQIDEAPADQKERLTKLLQERTQILANTRNELKN